MSRAQFSRDQHERYERRFQAMKRTALQLRGNSERSDFSSRLLSGRWHGRQERELGLPDCNNRLNITHWKDLKLPYCHTNVLGICKLISQGWPR